MNKSLGGAYQELIKTIDGVKDQLDSLARWALLLYLTLAGGLLIVIARTFNWI